MMTYCVFLDNCVKRGAVCDTSLGLPGHRALQEQSVQPRSYEDLL